MSTTKKEKRKAGKEHNKKKPKSSSLGAKSCSAVKQILIKNKYLFKKLFCCSTWQARREKSNVISQVNLSSNNYYAQTAGWNVNHKNRSVMLI